jgi:tRNA A37 threonylcarbamoyladenosine synthetase subunit TsaC/SUA5/YrdC
MKRLPPLYLTSSDTTIGFLSQDANRLDRVKRRPPGQPYLIALPSLRSLQTRVRVPTSHRRRIRRSSRTTFIYPNGQSYRVVRDRRHLLLLRRLGWAFSTSANLSGHPYDEAWAREQADVIVEPLGRPAAPSRILKLGKGRVRKIR